MCHGSKRGRAKNKYFYFFFIQSNKKNRNEVIIKLKNTHTYLMARHEYNKKSSAQTKLNTKIGAHAAEYAQLLPHSFMLRRKSCCSA